MDTSVYAFHSKTLSSPFRFLSLSPNLSHHHSDMYIFTSFFKVLFLVNARLIILRNINILSFLRAGLFASVSVRSIAFLAPEIHVIYAMHF